MEYVEYDSVADFLSEAEGFLETEEACNNLMLGIAYSLQKNPLKYGTSPFLAAVKENGIIQIAALMTPPHRLILYSSDDNCEATCQFLINKILKSQIDIPGVIGPNNIASTFKKQWELIHSHCAKLSMSMRVYVLNKVEMPKRPSGHFRIAKDEDALTIQKWIDNFYQDVFPNNNNVIKDDAILKIKEGNLFVWDDNGLVTMVDKRRPTKNGYVIGLVYTPENQRNKGYATANVAELCQLILNSGKKYCSLFTDLSNPISNSIYQKIGFKPLCDFYDYSFTKK